jgi:hypothetical protein
MIPLKEGSPDELNCVTYPLTKRETNILREAIEGDLKKVFIRHRTSSFISPVFFIPKKDGNKLRMVIDYRKLNDMTKKDFYLLPNLWVELE